MDEDKPQKLFVDGMSFFKPREGAPDFVKGSISIDAPRLGVFLKANKQHMSTSGYFNIDLKKSAAGKLYLELNTYKKKSEPKPEIGPIESDEPW